MTDEYDLGYLHSTYINPTNHIVIQMTIGSMKKDIRQ